MPPTYIFGTGFELASFDIQASQHGAGNFIVTSPVHTGGRAQSVEGTGGGDGDSSGMVYAVPTTPSEMYFAMWVRPESGSGTAPSIRFRTSDGDVELRFDGTWDAYRSGTLIASGAETPGANVWGLIEAHILIDDSVGRVETRVNGIDDIDFTGDTKNASATAIDDVQFFGQSTNGKWYYDDMTMATADWIGDVRYDPVLATSDDVVAWTRSAGSNNFETIDEVPPSDADFNTGDADNEQDSYGLADWSGAGKTPVLVVHWIRAQKDEASAHQLEQVVDDGSTEKISTAFDLTTAFDYYYELHPLNPSGGAWTETIIDALVFGMRSQIA